MWQTPENLPSGGGAGLGAIFDVALCVLVVRRLRTIREHFKNVALYPHVRGVEGACSARAKEAFSQSPRNLRLQGKAHVQDGPCFARKYLKNAVFSFWGFVFVERMSEPRRIKSGEEDTKEKSNVKRVETIDPKLKPSKVTRTGRGTHCKHMKCKVLVVIHTDASAA